MYLLLAALILVASLAVWLMFRRRQAGKSTAQKAVTRARSTTATYHAVSIKFSSSACSAARDLEGRRFLSSAAPKLPLADCDVLECKCRFVHHKDRRAGKDRRSPFAPTGFSSTTGSHQVEQREGNDRRDRRDKDLI
jgi:hypothetical protein